MNEQNAGKERQKGLCVLCKRNNPKFTMIFVLLLVILTTSGSSASQTCRPIISKGSLSKLELGEYVFIDCLIATCTGVIEVIFQKTGLTTGSEWTSVFEGFNKTNYQTLNVTNLNYSLDNRYSYKAFRAKHILNVKHLTLEDQGEWRCVVVDTNRKYPSNSIAVSLYVTPEERRMNITSKNNELLVDRPEEFTCTIDDINPEPVVLWKINDTEYSGGTISNIKHTNGLWYVKNILQLSFSQIGETAIKCMMKIGTNNQSLERSVEKHIQESAKIAHPVAEMDVEAKAYSPFTLNCTGTAYKPSITWTLDGKEISNNGTEYRIDQKCNTLMCQSSITSKSIGGCLDMLHYAGIYRCIVTSEQPYLSTQISPNMNVNIPIKQCKDEYIGLKLQFTLWIAKFISLIVLCIGLISVAVVFYRCRIKEEFKTDQTEPLINKINDTGVAEEFVNCIRSLVSIETVLDSVSGEDETHLQDSGIGECDHNDTRNDGDLIYAWKKKMTKIFQLVLVCGMKTLFVIKTLDEEDYKRLQNILKNITLKFNVYDKNGNGSLGDAVNNIEQVAINVERNTFMAIQNYSTGPLRLLKSSAYGDFIIVENTGDKVEDLNGYSIIRLINVINFVTYIFAEVLELQVGRRIKLWSEESKPKHTTSDETIAVGIKSWGNGNEMITILVDRNKSVVSIMKQQFI